MMAGNAASTTTMQTTTGYSRPAPPSTQTVLGFLPDGRIAVNMTLDDRESVDALIEKLNAIKAVIRPRSAPEKEGAGE